MTERLYYTDSYCVRFSGRIVEQLTWEGHPAVVLDRTAFYPTSGGQPSDRGTLGGVAVLDVVVREEDGAIVHILSGVDLLDFPKPERSQVEGLVDWPRRFDHMQQHTGQHILSAAFEQVLDADTVGFHLGAETSTVDINVPRLDPTLAAKVEELSNRVVWENRQVSVRFVGPDELAALPLRRPPTVEGPVRIVEIVNFDLNPCGGTHVARSGEIGLIKIVRLDYRGNETRVEFLCGGRAWRDYRDKNAMTTRLSGLLTVGHWELAQAVERLQGEAKHLRQELRRVRKRSLKMEAAELAKAAVARGPYRVVWRVWEGREPGELRSLVQELARNSDVVALLAGVGERAHLCFACAEGLDLDVASLLREACSRLGGKGGGQPRLAQGSAPVTDPARVKAVIADLL
ncbi:MAG: alanyl-tRNA editing protein [Chloroflexi bacterium]|nr:MAG: alanyl-tRNA editing protein [Chloroflexota bacterium]